MIISDDDLNLHDQFFSFTVPYVKGNQINTKLYFQLIITYKDGHTTQHDVNVIVKRVFRAMIFQGGVALGAYEAGVFRALVEKLIKEDKNKTSRGLQYEKRPLFDIVAGTSIGGMNGAIVISNVTREDKLWEDNESWRDSAKKVIEFWRDHICSPSWVWAVPIIEGRENMVVVVKNDITKNTAIFFL